MVDENLVPPDLIDLANNNVSERVAVLVEYYLPLNLFDPLIQILLCAYHQTAAERYERDNLHVVVANLEIFAGQFLRLLNIDLRYRILDRLHHFTLDEYFNVPLLHIHDDTEFGILAVLLSHHHRKHIFHDPDEDILIDTFFPNHLRE